MLNNSSSNSWQQSTMGDLLHSMWILLSFYVLDSFLFWLSWQGKRGSSCFYLESNFLMCGFNICHLPTQITCFVNHFNKLEWWWNDENLTFLIYNGMMQTIVKIIQITEKTKNEVCSLWWVYASFWWVYAHFTLSHCTHCTICQTWHFAVKSQFCNAPTLTGLATILPTIGNYRKTIEEK